MAEAEEHTSVLYEGWARLTAGGEARRDAEVGVYVGGVWQRWRLIQGPG